MSPKATSTPWSGSNGGGEFGQELKRAQEHQNRKMAAESAQSPHTLEPPNLSSSLPSGASQATGSPQEKANGHNEIATLEPPAAMEPPAKAVVQQEPAESLATPKALELPSKDNGVPEPQGEEHRSPPPVFNSEPVDIRDSDPAGAIQVSDDETEDSAAGSIESAEAPVVGELPPGKVHVRALYDYEATQDGDLSFQAGDIIVADKTACSGDGWVSGECRGQTGIFPANYTEPC